MRDKPSREHFTVWSYGDVRAKNFCYNPIPEFGGILGGHRCGFRPVFALQNNRKIANYPKREHSQNAYQKH